MERGDEFNREPPPPSFIIHCIIKHASYSILPQPTSRLFGFALSCPSARCLALDIYLIPKLREGRVPTVLLYQFWIYLSTFQFYLVYLLLVLWSYCELVSSVSCVQLFRCARFHFRHGIRAIGALDFWSQSSTTFQSFIGVKEWWKSGWTSILQVTKASKLDGNNYLQWKFRVMTQLVARKLWKVTMAQEAWPSKWKDDGKDKAEGDNLEEKDAQWPSLVWRLLTRLFLLYRQPKVQTRYGEFYRISMRPRVTQGSSVFNLSFLHWGLVTEIGDPVSDHITKFKALRINLQLLAQSWTCTRWQ